MARYRYRHTKYHKCWRDIRTRYTRNDPLIINHNGDAKNLNRLYDSEIVEGEYAEVQHARRSRSHTGRKTRRKNRRAERAFKLSHLEAKDDD